MISPGTSPSKEQDSRNWLLPSLFAWTFVILLAVIAILAIKPPKPQSIAAPATDFSAERAIVHLKVIARVPHPIGSAENAAVRDYLMSQLSALGLQPAIFSGFASRTFFRTVIAGNVQDIVARMPGTANSRAVLLMAHYDSVDHAPGAGDDGAGVAAILETLRALKAGSRLKNDVIVLLTDGEEAGLLGAQAFSASHPWMKEIGLIMNFEGRGDQGPSLLFQTSINNHLLIEEVGKSAPYAMGSSLFYSLYKLLPNDTDFSMFLPSAIPGLNFAFGAHIAAYHTELDTTENISQASLQHHGTYALALTRSFADIDLGSFQKAQGNDVFFNWLGSGFVTYSERWVLVGQVAVTVLLFLAILLNVRCREATAKGVGQGVLACLLLLLVIPVALWLVSWVAGRLLAGHAPVGDSSASAWLLTGYILLGGFVGLFFLNLFRGWLKVTELFLAGLFLVGLITWVIALMLPGGSYLLFWPLLLTCCGLLIISALGRNASRTARVWASVPGAAAALLLLFSFIYLLYIFLTLQPITASAIGVLLGLLLITCLPIFDAAMPQGRPVVIVVLLLAALGSIALGATRSRYSPDHPRPDNLLYAVNANDHTAAWISNDPSPDPWTSQFLTNNSQLRRPMPDYLGGVQWAVLSASAPELPILPPVATIESNTQEGSIHGVRLTIKSQRNANLISLVFNRDIQPLSIRIAGNNIAVPMNSTGFSIRLLGMADQKTELQLTLRAPSGVSFWLMDESVGLPDQLHPRPANFIAAPGSDLTMVSVKYTL
jgi:hypothetical protein